MRLRTYGARAQAHKDTAKPTPVKPMSLRLDRRLTHRMSRRTAPERPFGYILEFGFSRAGRGMR